MWQQWSNGVLGLWVILLPFLGLSGQAFLWTLVITGAAIAILSFWGATEHTAMEQEHHRGMRHA